MDNDFPVTLADIELRRDLVKAGWTDRDIAKHVGRGELTKIRYGAYVRSLLLAEMDPVALMRVQSRAVLRTAHPAAVLSHQAALAEWDVPLWGVSLAQVDLTPSGDCRVQQPAVDEIPSVCNYLNNRTLVRHTRRYPQALADILDSKCAV